MISQLSAAAGSVSGLSDLIDCVGRMLIGSLWQFAIVAAVLGLALRLMRRASPPARYAASLIALTGIVLLPAITWLCVSGLAERERETRAIAEARDLLNGGARALVQKGGQMGIPASAIARPDERLLRLSPAAIVRRFPPAPRAAEPWFLTMVAAWLLGVAACSLRPFFSWRTVRRLRVLETSPLPDALRQIFDGAAAKIGLQQKVSALQSGLIRIPAVVGYFRPLVLIPLSVATALPPDQLEALIVHELAHIRRHDYFVNLVQTALETIFFYHPAVWWISYQLRREREACCDEVVLGVCGNRFEYARALIALEELRASSPALALAAGGGSLLERIRRIVGAPEEPKPGPGAILWAGALVAAALVGFSIGSGKHAAGSGLSAEQMIRIASIMPTAAPRGPFRMTLPDGAEFEVIGVCEHPTNGRAWWRADGSPIPIAPNEPFNSRVNDGPQSIHREFVIDALHDAGTIVQAHIEGGGSAAASSSEAKEGGKLRDRQRFAMAFPKNAHTAKVVIDYSGGPWTTIAQRDRSDGSPVGIGFAEGGVVFGEAVETQGAVRIPISYDLKSDSGEVRLLAVDNRGREHTPDQANFVSARNANLMSVEFRDIPLTEIKEFRLQTRRTQRIEFRNIALNPGQRSNVLIFIDGKPYLPGTAEAKPRPVDSLPSPLEWVPAPSNAGRAMAPPATLIHQHGDESDPRTSIGQSPYRAVLPDGSTIALVGVGRNRGTHELWWAPDGRQGAKFDRPFGWQVPFDSDNKILRKFLLESFTQAGTFSISANGSTTQSERQHFFGHGMYDQHQMIAAISETSPMTLFVRYFPKPWRTVATRAANCPPGMRQATFPEGNADITDPMQKNGGTQIVVAYEVKGREARIVAVDRNNTEHPPQGVWGDGKNHMQQVEFQVPLSRIHEFRFQIREYEAVEFRNVARVPEQKTSVEIYINGKRFLPDAAKADRLLLSSPYDFYVGATH
ncbi:MAG TPA: M56 family metallopeptidase [Planctomycetaceae bacterium]|jgi:beta-lactamase regulating signal transducer with metallopeptidase domain|nr:M56 family metallopeptidase [Planctomycetaceae bacterium]